MTQRSFLTDEERGQAFGVNPDAPGGRRWEATCAAKALPQLRREAWFSALAYARKREHLKFLRKEGP